MTLDKAVKIRLRKSFSARLEDVFDAWLIPAVLGKWMFGSDSGTVEIISLENMPRKSGSFSFKINRQGLMQEYAGQYLEIRRPDRLSFTWSAIVENQERESARVFIELLEEAHKTRLNLVYELPARLADRSQEIKNEWAGRLSALSASLERSTIRQRELHYHD